MGPVVADARSERWPALRAVELHERAFLHELVWTGGAGWVYLRGDRQPAESFGTLELR